jgi:hypothetical protein
VAHGAANLFTEETLSRTREAEHGCRALDRLPHDEASLLAVIAASSASSRVALVASERGGREDLLLVGGSHELRADITVLAARLSAPALADRLAPYGIRRVEDLLAHFEGPAAAFAALAPAAANTDDNAFVETRIPRRLDLRTLAFDPLEARLAPGTPVLPPLRGALDASALSEALLARAQPGARFPLAASSRFARARCGAAQRAPRC